jgi:hypothetical protein
MCSEANHYSSFLSLPRPANDGDPSAGRSQVPTAAVVFGGLAVWGLFLLLML